MMPPLVPVDSFFPKLLSFVQSHLIPSFILLFAVVIGFRLLYTFVLKTTTLDTSFKANVTHTHGKAYVKRNPGLFK